MPSWPVTYTSPFVGSSVLSTAAENVVATVTGVGTDATARRVRLFGQVNLTAGTTATGFTLRLRRDSLTGTVVNTSQVDTLAAAVGSPEDHSILGVDAPGELANATYVLTVQQNGAVATGSFNSSTLEATAHN